MAIIVKITKEKYERTLKLTGNFEQMNINGQYNIDLYNINRFALHTSPYIVFTNHGYTKHYYVEADRIASKIGGGMSHSGNNFGEHVDAFDVDYRMKAELSKEQERVHLDSAQSNLGKQFEVLVDVDFRKLQEFLAVDKPEKEIFYFHKDHLGSSTQISDMSRRVIHHIEYMPTGELFAEQRDYWHTPYRFNGKELDEETGLYYYGARYYTPELGIWLSVDPLSDKYPSMSAFMYCAGNPVVLVDPDGRELDVFITGFYAEEAFNDLQSSTALMLSRDENTGQVSIIGGKVQNEDDQQLMDAINSNNVSVFFDTSPDFETTGSFMGTTYSESSTYTHGDKSSSPILEVTQSVSTTNVANYESLVELENKHGAKRGTGAKHEITEGYQAGLISLSLRRGLSPAYVTETTRNINGNSVTFYSKGSDWGFYDIAHRRATRAPNE
jgi:RHS repeat-associated protein